MKWDINTLGSLMAISAQCVVVAVALRCSDWSRASPRRVRSLSQRCSVGTETALVEPIELRARLSASPIDLEDHEEISTPVAASVVQRRDASTSPRPSANHEKGGNLLVPCRIPLDAVRSCRSPASDDPSPSGSKTARARLLDFELSSQQLVPQQHPTGWPAVDERLQQLIRQVQLFPRSIAYWAALRSYLREKDEKERLAGQALQGDLPVVCFSEDPDLVAIQVEVRRRIAREGQSHSVIDEDEHPSDSSDCRSSSEAATATYSGGAHHPPEEPKGAAVRQGNPASDDSDEAPQFQQQYDLYCQRQRRKPRKSTNLRTSASPYDCLRVSSGSDGPDDAPETQEQEQRRRQHHLSEPGVPAAAVVRSPREDRGRVPVCVRCTTQDREEHDSLRQASVVSASSSASLSFAPQEVAPQATPDSVPPSADSTSRNCGGEGGVNSLLTFRRLQALQQHASYARLALDPTHQGFVKELRRFEAQLRLAAEKEASSATHHRKQSEAPGSAARERNFARPQSEFTVPSSASSSQRNTNKSTTTSSGSPEQVESWRSILRRSSQQLALSQQQQQSHGTRRRHRTPSPLRGSSAGADGEFHASSPVLKQTAAAAPAPSSIARSGAAQSIPAGEQAKSVARQSSFAAPNTHSRAMQLQGAADVNGGSTRVFARTDSYLKTSGNAPMQPGHRRFSTVAAPPAKVALARSISTS